MARQGGAECGVVIHRPYVAWVLACGQGVECGAGAGKDPEALLYHTMMTDPLSLSAGIMPRLLAAGLLLAGLWAGVAWALEA